MAVEGDSGVARVPRDTLQHFAREHLAEVALAQLGALRVVILVQLKKYFGEAYEDTLK